MKSKKILLGILDLITGFFVGAVGYRMINHYTNILDWCVIAICFVVIVVRLYSLIKAKKSDE